MRLRLLLALCFSVFAGLTIAAVAAGAWMVRTNIPETGGSIGDVVMFYGLASAFIVVVLVTIFWGFLDYSVVQPLQAVIRDIQIVLYANPQHRIDVSEDHQLDRLPEVVNDLIDQLAKARKSVDDAVAAATAQIEEQKNQLGVILRDLHEAVVVCTINHKILLYNSQAVELFRAEHELGLDRSLFDFVTRQPIQHALNRLTGRNVRDRRLTAIDQQMVSFVCSTVDGGQTLEGRISPLLDSDNRLTGYVISLQDDTVELAALARRDRLLRDATEGLRGPAGTLVAAAEILATTADLSDTDQAEFKRVIQQESRGLTERLERLAGEYRTLITGHWPMSDIYSADLFEAAALRLREQRNVATVMTGIPQWLHGDSYTLVELLARLIGRVQDTVRDDVFELEAVHGDRYVYLDVLWKGAAVTSQALNEWLEDPLYDELGGLTVNDALQRHKTDIWCMPQRDGYARLRLPLPVAVRPPSGPDRHLFSCRPEFYDFELLKRPGNFGELGQRPLRSISFVVFDTETTGLEPSRGDEIVSLAGVRVVNGRILTGESFERLVNPGRPIPKSSTRFHGITDEMVTDKPPIQVVLPQFRTFVGDAVLVAHNAAFDLKFIRLREGECGLTFDMPVLDTLLLSVFLHEHTSRHTLDAIAERFGIPVQGRHTALGDSLVTAGVFLRMIDMLHARGVTTLDEAVEAGNRIVEVRARQAEF